MPAGALAKLEQAIHSDLTCCLHALQHKAQAFLPGGTLAA